MAARCVRSPSPYTSHMHMSSLRLRVFEAEDLREPVLEEQLSVSAAEELLRVPLQMRPDLADQAVRERWTPAQARRARLAARAKWLESNHQQPDGPAVGLEERFRTLTAALQSVEVAQLSR